MITLKTTNLTEICPYADLLAITPRDDEFFKLTPEGRCFTLKSDGSIWKRRNRSAARKREENLGEHPLKALNRSGNFQKEPAGHSVDLKGKLNEYIGPR